MKEGVPAAFFSYCREDSDFALRLAGDLKAAGARVWLDQLDIRPGDLWDHAIEDALANCPHTMVLLSPSSVSSKNVLDEVYFALEERKTVIPLIYRDCTVPYRLRRVQHVDFRQDYARGLQALLNMLAPARSAEQRSALAEVVANLGPSEVPKANERKLEKLRFAAESVPQVDKTRAGDAARKEGSTAAPVPTTLSLPHSKIRRVFLLYRPPKTYGWILRFYFYLCCAGSLAFLAALAGTRNADFFGGVFWAPLVGLGLRSLTLRLERKFVTTVRTPV